MSQVSDVQRALEPRVYGDPGNRYLTNLGGPRPQALSLREASLTLGRVFLALDSTDRPLGDWALPHQKTLGDERVLDLRLNRALERVYGKDAPTTARFRAYDDALDLVTAQLQDSAVAWGVATLAAQAKTLQNLRSEVANAVFKVWMHQVADEIVKGSWEARGSDMRLILAGKPTALRARGDLDAIAASRQFRIRESAMRVETVSLNRPFPMVVALRQQFVNDLRILRAVKQFPDVIEAYQRSADEGTALLQTLITRSTDAIGSFSSNIAETPAHVWRYAALIVGGLRVLGLDTLPGVQDFFVALAGVRADRSANELFNIVGMGLLVVGLASTGVGTGALILDFLFGGATAYFTFTREHEHDLAARASLFFPDQGKFAVESGYGETAIAIGFMLVAAYSLLRGVLKKLPVRLGRQVEPPRGPLDQTARGTTVNEASAGRRTDSRATLDVTAPEPSPVETSAPAQTQTPAQAPPPPKAKPTQKVRTQEKMTSRPAAKSLEEPPPPSSTLPQDERLTHRPVSPRDAPEATAARQVEGSATPQRRELPPYPENQYQGAAHGGSARVREVLIGGSEEATIAHEARLDLMRNGAINYSENIAVVRYKNPRTKKMDVIWAKNNGDQHAERVLVDRLKQELGSDYHPGLLEKLYTERIPCGRESRNCYGWIRSELYNAEIEFSFATQTIPATATKPARTIDANQELMSFYMQNFDPKGNRLLRE